MRDSAAMFLLGQSTHRMVIQHHSQIGHLFVPKLNARLPSETGGYFVRTNSQGFRSDREFAKAKGDSPRILFFGDSYTAGDGCDNHQRFAERVGEQFGAEVYNYGLSGSGTDQQLLIFEEFARDVEADLIVLGVMVENIERIQVPARETIDRVTGDRVLVPKPYFTLESDNLRLHQVPVPRERARADQADAGDYQQTFANQHPQLVKLLDTYRRNPRLKSVRALVDRFAPGMRSQILRAGNYTPYPDYNSEDSAGWKLMRAICERFCDSVGDTPILIVPIPPYWFYYDGLKPNYRDRFASLEDRQRGRHVADITAPFLQLPRSEREAARFPIDPHYSPTGHQHVANFIGAEISKRGLLPSASKPKMPAARAPRSESKTVLGISCFYHNSAAALVRDGEIVAASEEERFSRIKNDRRFPHNSINFCLEQAGLHANELSAIVYYDNAALTFERLLHTLSASDQGSDAFLRTMPSWIHYKLHIPQLIRRALRYDGLILQEEHHRSHAASCFLPSPFESAAILTVDGVGEWATACIGQGRGSSVELLSEMHFPHSLGLLYSAFTQFTGFKVNSGEYKMMGLAPYGAPKYVDVIRDNLVDIKADGSIELNLDCFSYLSKPTMTNDKFAQLFGGPARDPDAWISPRERDIARSIQVVTEEVVQRMACHAQERTGEKQLCMAGGVALNCVSNGRLLREGPFEDVWIQPAAGDSGAALGAALDAYHNSFGEPRVRPESGSMQRASLLGPSFSAEEIRAGLDTHAHPYHELTPEERPGRIAQLLAEGKVVGHMAGRAEFGPRSLGARSILGDPRNQTMQSTLNLKIKYRESFRPFAPSVLKERCADYFDLDSDSPYMLIVAPVREDRRLPFEHDEGDDMREIVNRPRSDLPAITHIDYSARIQTVDRRDNPVYHGLISAFGEQTGCSVVVNTSFNVRGEPIVLTPHDAYRCFMRTEMDVLVLENFILFKEEQPEWPEPKGQIEEHDTGEPTEVPPALKGALQTFYDQQFRNASRALRQGHALQVRIGDQPYGEVSTTWTPHRPAAAGDPFRIPSELDASEANAKQMAQALSQSWSAGDATAVFRDLTEKLLEIGLRIPAEEELDEDVSESVYVMF